MKREINRQSAEDANQKLFERRLWRFGGCFLIFIAACSGAADHPVESPHATADPEPAVHVAGAPTIAFAGAEAAEGRWKLAGLPAVARGGELVVVPMTASDGGRGYPNLRLDVRDRSDKLVRSIEVLKADEWEKLQAADGSAGPELQKRIADANRELEKMQSLNQLVAMHPLDVQIPAHETRTTAHLAIGDGFDVDFNGDHLHVFRHNASRSFITLDARPWLAPPQKAAGEPCSNPAFLANTYHATNINVLVVELGYTGTDTCWEPGNQMHVVAW